MMADMFDAKKVRPMRIGESREAFDSPDYIYELKLNGERCVAFLDPLMGTVFRDKDNLNLLGKVPELAKIHKRVNAKCILDGELIVAVNGEPGFYEIRRRLQESDKFKIYLQSSLSPATFVAFDILYHVNHEVTSWTVTQRKQLMEQVIAENERLVASRYEEERGVDLLKLAEQRNMVGVVAKRKESRYYPDQRSKDWIFCRNPQDEDFVVCGYIPKEERASNVLLGQYEGEKLAYKGRVALGFSTNDCRVMASHRRVDAPPFDLSSAEAVVWLEPTLVCTVRYMEKMQTGFAGQQPVFRGFRLDKAAAECRKEHMKEPVLVGS